MPGGKPEKSKLQLTPCEGFASEWSEEKVTEFRTMQTKGKNARDSRVLSP
jgi:hypothetical protein